MRILHLSDLHLTVPWGDLPLRAWLGKRLLGGANFLLGRGKAYARSNEKLGALDRFRVEHAVDFVLCTGDYTAFGSELELERAAALTAPLRTAPLGFATVPGNHDLYVADTFREGRFEHHFGAWMTTDLPEHRLPGACWPWVRFLGDDAAIVAVNSALPRPLWSSTGRVPPAQLEALRAVLEDPRVRSRFVFVATHYAVRLENDRPDRRSHALENADDLVEVVKDLPRAALLSGHVHRRYTTRVGDAKPPLFCAGSATKEGREGLWVFDVDAEGVTATPGRFDGEAYRLETEEAVRVSESR